MYCGNCGTKLKDGKCPKCDKKEVKQVKEVKTNNETASFGWFLIGFFVPLAGLILFFVFMHKKESLSKRAGLGALIGYIKNIIIIVVCYIATFYGVFSFINYFNEPYNIGRIMDYNNIFDYDDNDEDDDIINSNEIINITDIDATKKFDVHGYSPELMKEFTNKEYEFDNLKVSRNNNQLVIKSINDDSVLYTYNNVKNAYYHAGEDCNKRIDAIVIVATDKTYYIDPIVHVEANMKPVTLYGNYTGYYYASNHSLTCGGSILALGKSIYGSYYDLNGEVPMDFDNIYYYDNSNNWISINRGYKLAGYTGSVKVSIMGSEAERLQGIIDSYGYAYKYVYDDGAMPEISTITKVNSSPVKQIEVNNNDNSVILTFENSEQYTFDYAVVEY